MHSPLRWDNHYEYLNGQFVRRENEFHTVDGMKGDMRCHNILISRCYKTFPVEQPEIPDRWRDTIHEKFKKSARGQKYFPGIGPELCGAFN